MIAALNNTTNLNGPGASTGQSARVREADVSDSSTSASTASQVEASAVVSLSPQAASLAASETQAPAQAQAPAAKAAPAPASVSAQPTQTEVPAPAPTPTPAAAPKTPTTVTAQSTSFQPTNARAAVVSQDEKFPEPISLVPNLVYAEADSDQNGVISPSERRSYDVLHPTLGQRAADVPPKRVVDAELREYASIAKNQF
jgi:glucose/arabinose dehydrogenase